jgi:adenylyltransferase/sulfurtransferase
MARQAIARDNQVPATGDLRRGLRISWHVDGLWNGPTAHIILRPRGDLILRGVARGWIPQRAMRQAVPQNRETENREDRRKTIFGSAHFQPAFTAPKPEFDLPRLKFNEISNRKLLLCKNIHDAVRYWPGRSKRINACMDLNFTDDEVRRYARHILLREVGGTGQARLKSARVLIVGAGGLGSPLALYLAAAGVGTIGIIDPDVLELSNLQRQIAHTTENIGQMKVTSAAAAMRAINPLVTVETHHSRLDAGNVRALLAPYDIICDGTDNFETRFLLADACVAAKRTLVSAAVLRFEGQLSTFKPHTGPDAPCYRCLYPEPPPDGLVPSCSEAGVLGAVTGVMGTLQATEVLKEIIGIGESLSGRLLIWDALAMEFRLVRLKRDPQCPVCSA